MRGQRPIQSISGAVILALALGACAAPRAEDVESFVLEYETGSIPPPGNYEYRVEGSVDDDGGLEVAYTLTYRFREDLTAAELDELGYGPDDDLSWSTVLTGEQAAAWLDLAARSDLQAAGESQPGSDSIAVTVRMRNGDERSGEPADRDAWEALADALDADARVALGHPRPGR